MTTNNPYLNTIVNGDCLARVEFAHVGVTEWWTQRNVGVQQGWDLVDRPAGSGPLMLDIAVTGAVVEPASSTQAARLVQLEREWSYADAIAWDADGRALPAHLEADDAMLHVVVDDEEAVWPIFVDPLASTPSVTLPGDFDLAALGGSVANAGDVNATGLISGDNEGRRWTPTM